MVTLGVECGTYKLMPVVLFPLLSCVLISIFSGICMALFRMSVGRHGRILGLATVCAGSVTVLTLMSLFLMARRILMPLWVMAAG